MAAYLLIENNGVCPAELFTLLGASTKRGSGSNVIGKFGSGNKHGVAVCLRHGLKPVIFCGTLKLEFFTREQQVDTGIDKHEFARVCVKYGGKDSEGVNRSSTEDLGYVLEYGATDWLGVDLACREFVSNALDREIEEGEHNFTKRFKEGCAMVGSDFDDYDVQQRYEAALSEYRANARDFQNVTVKIVADNQVRAKAGCTRVFIPLNDEVQSFYDNLGRWFLHFSEPELLHSTILPKRNRNLSNRKAAVIYRRGVRVREFESSDMPSLFDYNLSDLELDEARKVDDWKVRHHAGRALVDAPKDIIQQVFQAMLNGDKVWEHQFDTYALEPSWQDSTETVTKRVEVWTEAFETVAANAVLVAEGSQQVNTVRRKGYEVIEAPQNFVKAIEKYGVRTPAKVLSQDDREGRTIIDATPDAIAVTDWVWELASLVEMTDGKQKPSVKCFSTNMDAGSLTEGFYRDNTVFYNTCICGDASVEGGVAALTHKLRAVAIEEVAHYITGATDNSRDFQDWAFNFAARVAALRL